MTQSGVQIREITEADVRTVADIRVRGWRWAYAGIVPQPYLDAMDPEEDAEQRREFLARSRGRVQNLLAVVDGEPVGWAAFGPYRGEPDDAGDGELYALYVLPEHVGTGVGRALTSAAVLRTAELGRGRLLLWVLADNARARRFYAAAGFAPDGAETSDDYDGVPLREVRYVRRVP
ncbi:GNAT family N-acetyltransferase [Streptomyces sp. NPDC020917]|uniref:GNAT family N-acetyltransferase n=1 Tax=Streptomyces sp. NPDC020917 TaxID=3365102 RepID=UPI003795E39B